MIIKEFQNSDGTVRLQVVRRDDGKYSYRQLWRSGDVWSVPGPDCGIYDDELTAETEARLKVKWLQDARH